MTELLEIELANFQFQLLADRGLYWPTQDILFVADTHLGKEATFRSHGIPVPVGSSITTLERLTHMLRTTNARQLCILGDMFHARSSLSTDVRLALDSFFAEFSDLEFTLVRGNHDAGLQYLPPAWPVKVVEPGLRVAGIALGHHPATLPDNAALYLCGHLHPAIRLSSKRESLGKMACFWHSRGCVVLPAVGDFTGTHAIKAAPDDQVWIVADNQISQVQVDS